MSFVHVWGHALSLALARILPPTIHPMVVHFPIALLYLCAGVDVLALILPDQDRFLQRCGFWLLTLANAATVVAIVAGQVAEQSLKLTPVVVAALHQHTLFVGLTGLAEGAAWILRVLARYPRRKAGWSALGTGHGRGGVLTTALVVAAAILVAVAGHYGGVMVYQGGAGVAGVGRVPLPA